MKGFTLIEGLVAVFITFVVAVSIAGLLTYFGIYNRKNIDLSCNIMAVSSAIEACRGGVVRTSFSCGGRNITVSFSGNCNPPQGQCSQVTASAGNLTLTDVVCNLQ